MQRKSFLQSIFGTGLLLSVPPLQLLADEEQQKLAWLNNAHRIFVYDCYISGFRFYEGPNKLDELKIGEKLDVVREPDNEYDENAVAIYWEGEKLGFLPMDDNLMLSRMLDGGLLLEATIIKTKKNSPPWRMCKLKVEMVIPSNDSFHQFMIAQTAQIEKAKLLRPDGPPPPPQTICRKM